MLHLALKAFYPSQAAVPAAACRHDLEVSRDDRIPRRDGGSGSASSCIVHVNEDGLARGISPIASGSALHTQVMKTEALRQALDKYGNSTRRSAAPAATRKRAAPRSASSRSARPATPGTRATSGPNSGGSSTPASSPAKRSASSRCPTGPSSTSGNTSAPKKSRSCRSISPRSGRWSSATAR